MRRGSMGMLAAGLLLGATGCPPPHPRRGPMPACLAEVESGDEEVGLTDIPTSVWFSLMLRRFDHRSFELQRPPRSCTNQPIALVEEDAPACMHDASLVPLPGRTIDPSRDLSMVLSKEGRHALVWVRTDHFEGGMAMGAVALISLRRHGIAVDAIGTLVAPVRDLRMYFVPLDITEALVVEGRSCVEAEARHGCTTYWRVLPRKGQRFESPPLHAEDGTCLGPPAFVGQRVREIDRKVLLTRRYTLHSALKVVEGQAMIEETLVVEDVDPGSPDAAPMEIERKSLQRPLRTGVDGIVVPRSLWDEVPAVPTMAVEPTAVADESVPEEEGAESPEPVQTPAPSP